MTTDEGQGAIIDDLSGQRALEAFLLCLVMIFSAVGNISLWIIVLTTPALRSLTNMFILGLSAAGNVFILSM